MINSDWWSFWCDAKVVYFILFWRRFSGPKAYRRICSRARKFILFGTITIIFWWFLWKYLMARISVKIIACKGVIRLGTWAIVSVFSSYDISWLDWRMRLPSFFDFRTWNFSPYVVSAWSRNLIAFVLRSVCKGGLLAYWFELIFLFRPGHCDVIMIGWRRIQFFLSFADKI